MPLCWPEYVAEYVVEYAEVLAAPVDVPSVTDIDHCHGSRVVLDQVDDSIFASADREMGCEVAAERLANAARRRQRVARHEVEHGGSDSFGQLLGDLAGGGS
jgi:hypothetical protein